MIRDIGVISDFIKTNLVDNQIFGITLDDFNIFAHENNGYTNPIILRRINNGNIITDDYCHGRFVPSPLTIITEYDPNFLANDTNKTSIEYDTTHILCYIKQHHNVTTLKGLILVLFDIMNSIYSLDTLSRIFRESNIKITLDNSRKSDNIRCLMYSLIFNIRNHTPFAYASIVNIEYDIDKIDVVSLMLLIQVQKIRHFDPIKSTVIFLMSLIESVTIR